MSQPTIAPYGSWRSPIDARTAAAAGVRLAEPQLAAGATYWLEGRPAEGGRYVVVEHRRGRGARDVTPDGINVRTRVHEYGGGSFIVSGDAVIVANFEDQRLYRVPLDGGAAQPITAEPPVPAAHRYADLRLLADGRTLVCVRERHAVPGATEAVNELVALPLDGGAEPRVLATGADFYAFPRPSPDGRWLAWTQWDHPNMPWDGSELWITGLTEGGEVSDARRLAGGRTESVFQPEWSPDGALHFVSDRTGWWNLYRVRERGVEPLLPAEAEFGHPQWVFGLATYGFLADGCLVCLSGVGGLSRLGIVADGRLEPVELPFSSFGPSLATHGTRVALLAASPTRAEAVVAVDVADGSVDVLRESMEAAVEPGYLSVPEPIEFPTDGGRSAHAFYYRPANRDFAGPDAERPPLIVHSHGGPTGSTSAALDLGVQYWTSRGLAVVDVDYGGSTGYGRAYRQRLRGEWGIVDTADCVNAARYLADRGDVDPQRMAISGGSAGGYTTLCALTFHGVFAAGVSYFGIGDLETFVGDTHKFESRYLEGLVGPYPAMRDTYRARSPLNHLERLTCPVLVLQGLEDEVVPPAQAEQIVAALADRGIPHAYLPFEGEQHGFRRAENIIRAREAELSFYAQVFGFTPADAVEPVELGSAARAAARGG